MTNENNIKSGQNVYISGLLYLFLGYSDYKRLQCVVADQHGNRATVFSTAVSTRKW